MLTVGSVLVAFDGPSRLAVRRADIQGIMKTLKLGWADCAADDLIRGGRRIGDPTQPVEVVLLGSSHGVVYVEALDEFLRSHGVGGVSFARGEESPLIAGVAGLRTRRGLDVAMRDREIDSWIAAWKPRVVLCCHRWSHELLTATASTPNGNGEYDDRASEFAQRVAASVESWSKYGAHVVLVGEVPQNSYSKAKFEALLYLGGAVWKEPVRAGTFRRLAANVLRNGAGTAYDYLDVAPLFLDGESNVRVMSATGALWYGDDNHMSDHGARAVVGTSIGPLLVGCLHQHHHPEAHAAGSP